MLVLCNLLHTSDWTELMSLSYFTKAVFSTYQKLFKICEAESGPTFAMRLNIRFKSFSFRRNIQINALLPLQQELLQTILQRRETWTHPFIAFPATEHEVVSIGNDNSINIDHQVFWSQFCGVNFQVSHLKIPFSF